MSLDVIQSGAAFRFAVFSSVSWMVLLTHEYLGYFIRYNWSVCTVCDQFSLQGKTEYTDLDTVWDEMHDAGERKEKHSSPP